MCVWTAEGRFLLLLYNIMSGHQQISLLEYILTLGYLSFICDSCISLLETAGTRRRDFANPSTSFLFRPVDAGRCATGSS